MICTPRLLTLLLLAALTGPAQAQSRQEDSRPSTPTREQSDVPPAAEEEQPLPLYRVEFIVFRNVSAASLADEERWHPPPPADECGPPLAPDACEQPAEEAALAAHCEAAMLTEEECARLLPVVAGGADDETMQAGAQTQPTDADDPGAAADAQTDGSSEEAPVQFVPIPLDELALDRVYDRLGNARSYDRILHRGWVQPGLGRDAAVAVMIAANDGGAFVTGEVTLSLERFLHLDIDLRLDVDGESHVMHQGRRLRSGETHYFDHPRFGVIALVSPQETDTGGGSP